MAKKMTIRELNRSMEHAADYRSWREAAETLDELEGADAWRAKDESRDYNWRLIKSRLEEVRQLREAKDVPKLVFWLHEGLHGNLGNMANPQLYTRCRVGTKFLVEDYVREISSALDFLCEYRGDDFPAPAKIRFFRRTGRAFGRSALMLSGGATLGMFHIGVLKALWQEGLLPRVISGSSAGSIIAAAIGTHTNDELNQMFDPGYLYLHAWEALGLKGMLKRGALMDGDQLERCIAQNIGDLTFEEAFEKTQRIINIPVSPYDKHQQSRLLNYLSSPNVLIRSASRASCAIPGVFEPVTLLAKNFHNGIQPYITSAKWVDGSLNADLPMLRTARFHNCNHYIVSQTNPHVVPLLNKEQKAGNGLLPFGKKFLGSSYRFYSQQFMDLAQNHLDMKGPLRIFEKMHNVTAQRYTGDVTVFPKQGLRELMGVIANPSSQDIENYIRAGERSTWPHLERIRNSSMISRTFESCLQRMKDRGEYRRTVIDPRES